jgi:phospholipid transport system substrate-binding protein
MITRRHILALLPFAVATSAVAADHPSVVFMNEVASQLLKAHRLGTVPAFMRVIQRYADIPAIGDYSLGEYKLNSGQLARYHHGVAQFISRYFVDQSKSYPIAKYEIGEATVAPNKDVVISSRVYLMAGQIYTVNWILAWSGGTYKITDAKFLGFSMTAQERSLFTSYIAKHNGDVEQLVIALNR